MARRPKPKVHGRDHEHGGPDPQLIHYEDVGDDGSGGVFALIPFAVSGDLTVGAGGLRWYAPADGTIALVHASLGTAAVGSGVTVQVNRNGASIGNVTLAPGGNVATFTPASPGFEAGDYFTVDVTAIGSTSPGSDLVTQVHFG